MTSGDDIKVLYISGAVLPWWALLVVVLTLLIALIVLYAVYKIHLRTRAAVDALGAELARNLTRQIHPIGVRLELIERFFHASSASRSSLVVNLPGDGQRGDPQNAGKPEKA